jgi:hypothetical protein
VLELACNGADYGNAIVFVRRDSLLELGLEAEDEEQEQDDERVTTKLEEAVERPPWRRADALRNELTRAPRAPRAPRKYKPRQCAWPGCEVVFTPTGPRNKFCPVHRAGGPGAPV